MPCPDIHRKTTKVNELYHAIFCLYRIVPKTVFLRSDSWLDVKVMIIVMGGCDCWPVPAATGEKVWGALPPATSKEKDGAKVASTFVVGRTLLAWSVRPLHWRHQQRLWQVVWSIWVPAGLPVWPNKIFKSLSTLITGQYPAGFLMLVYLLEIDSPLVALMPFNHSLTYKKTQIDNHSSFAPGATPKTTQQRCTQSSGSQSITGR